MAKGRGPMMGGFPGGGNMNNMIKQAQKMQENLLKAQEEFDDKTFDVSTGGGAVTLTINGKNEVTALNIKPEVVDPDDIEMLEDLIISAINEGIKTVDKEKSESMSKIAGPMSGLSGLF